MGLDMEKLTIGSATYDVRDNSKLPLTGGVIDGTIWANRGVFNELIATTLKAETATIDDLTAQNATVVGLLDVQGQIHSNSWTNANIANIGGSFYITPTIEPTSSQATISIIHNSATNWTITITGTFATNTIKTGTNTNGVNWPANSLIVITGDVVVDNMTYPLGTLKGTLNAQVTATAAGTSKTITLTGVTDGQGNTTPAILQRLYELNNNTNISNATLTNGKISLYQIGNYPIGIQMSSMGTNANSMIEIYGGISTNPTVRIGHLAGLPNVNGSAPTGWGIYTDNGYFTGVIVSTAGKIGNWTIENTTSSSPTYGGALYTGSFGTDNGIFITPSYTSSTSIGGSTGSKNWTLTASNNFGVTTDGTLYAQNAKIMGSIIASSFKVEPNATIIDEYGLISNSEIKTGGRNLLRDTGNREGYRNSSLPNIVPIIIEYQLTSDSVININKTYYIRTEEEGEYVYIMVAEPKVEDIHTYYERYELFSTLEVTEAEGFYKSIESSSEWINTGSSCTYVTSSQVATESIVKDNFYTLSMYVKSTIDRDYKLELCIASVEDEFTTNGGSINIGDNTTFSLEANTWTKIYTTFKVPNNIIVYNLTSDEEIDIEKTYYTKSGEEGAYIYTVVANPQTTDLGIYYERFDGDIPVYARLLYGPNNNSCLVYVKEWKLERGNQSTDWSPAPEDMVTTDTIEGLSGTLTEAVQKIEQMDTNLSNYTESTTDRLNNMDVDIGNAAATATNYILPIYNPLMDRNGIVVHDYYDPSTGIRITNNIELIRDDKPQVIINDEGLLIYAAEYKLTTDVAINPNKHYYIKDSTDNFDKYIRVLEPNIEDINTYYERIDSEIPVARYGDTAIIGKTNDYHIQIANKQLGFYEGDSTNADAYLDDNKLFIQKTVTREVAIGEEEIIDSETGKSRTVPKQQWSWKTHKNINGQNNLGLRWGG